MDPLALITPFDAGRSFEILTQNGGYDGKTLLRQAAGIAKKVQKAGIDQGRVILSVDNGPRFFSGVTGCWLAGAVPVLLDPLVKQELSEIIRITEARGLIHGFQNAPDIPADVVQIFSDETEVEPEAATPRAGDEPLVYLATSGSSGKPTLVPKTFGQIDVEVRFLAELLERPGRVATMVPWCHIWGFLSSFLLPVRLGGVCDLSAGISPRVMLERASQGLVDLIVAAPAILQVMVRYLEAGGLPPLSGNCRVALAGAPISDALRERFETLSGCRLTDIYGSTEAGGIAYRHDAGPWNVEPHVEIRIDKQGFLEVRSPSVAIGAKDAFYRVGDVVRPEGDGFVLLGRQDDVVKIGGRRTALGEIQEVIERMPGVARAAVLAQDVRGKLRIAAYIQPDNCDFRADSVKSYVRSQLADHKVPRVVYLLDQLPLTTGGKVAKAKLAALVQGKN